MTAQSGAESGFKDALGYPAFRRIWLASLLSNLGMLINAVGAGWAMVEMGAGPGKVALVQTSIMLPYMLFALPAGAISDTYDRRTVGLVAVCFALASSITLFAIAVLGLLTPTLLLIMGFAIGSANALFTPVFVSSVGELLPRQHLVPGIGLNSISFNAARALGPAVGGALVAAFGSIAAFGANAFAFAPMLLAQLLWQRTREKPRLPPEQVLPATIAGIRYVFHTPPIRRVIVRGMIFGLTAGSTAALMPLITRDLLHGGPRVYGLLLGSYGVGSVAAVALINHARRRFAPEVLISGAIAIMGLSFIALSFTRATSLAFIILFVAGMCWLLVANGFSVAIQTRVPRWVIGRAVASFQAALSGGMAIGSILWGMAAGAHGIALAIMMSGVGMLANVMIGRILPLDARVEEPEELTVALQEPAIDLDITGRSGPISIIFEYDIPREQARAFYKALNIARRIRSRNGGFGWSVSRDIGDATRWFEQFTFPTWNDYLRMRTRMTKSERLLIDEGVGRPIRISRQLGRPSGSVRWTADTPDPGLDLTVGLDAGARAQFN